MILWGVGRERAMKITHNVSIFQQVIVPLVRPPLRAPFPLNFVKVPRFRVLRRWSRLLLRIRPADPV